MASSLTVADCYRRDLKWRAHRQGLYEFKNRMALRTASRRARMCRPTLKMESS